MKDSTVRNFIGRTGLYYTLTNGKFVDTGYELKDVVDGVCFFTADEPFYRRYKHVMVEAKDIITIFHEESTDESH